MLLISPFSCSQYLWNAIPPLRQVKLLRRTIPTEHTRDTGLWWRRSPSTSENIELMRVHPKGPAGTPTASKCWYSAGSWIWSSESMLSAGVYNSRGWKCWEQWRKCAKDQRLLGLSLSCLLLSPPLLSPHSLVPLTCDVCWRVREGSVEGVPPPHEDGHHCLQCSQLVTSIQQHEGKTHLGDVRNLSTFTQRLIRDIDNS